MLPITVRSPPSVDDFTPLAEYQSQTPESFVGGKPVLHFHLASAKASVPKAHCGILAVFPSDSAATNGDAAEGDGEQPVDQQVAVFVTSEHFTIFSEQAGAGVSIPYPSIAIHAVKQVGTPPDETSTQAVWMQLELSDGGPDDDDFNTVELTIIPPASDASPSLASQLFEAIAKCSDLHPDPNDNGDEDEDEYDRIVFEGAAEHEAIEGFSGVLRGATDGSLPAPMPGSGGWITADNVHEYFDEDGNWIGEGGEGEELGGGAGRTRARDEVDGDEANGQGQEDDPDNKRPRVE